MTFIVENSAFAGEKQLLQWQKLPSIPDKEGFAGSFAGTHDGVLIVAGGANFPDKRPWEGGTKTWYDSVFALERPGGEWKNVFKMPHPTGYGVSISHRHGLLCIGGSNAKGHSAEVLSISWNGGDIRVTTLPNLPKPCANMCGALLDQTVYVAGGLETPDATNTLKTFWSLDLNNPNAGWKELETWPGPSRMLAAAAVVDGSFYLCGGADLKRGTDNKVSREWLRDSYCFTPGKSWKRIADLPRAAVAAPSPSPVLRKHHVFILGGDDGVQVNIPPDKHHGFSREILAYDPATNAWAKAGELPFGLVTTPCVNWNHQIVIPGGEARPGVRSTEVWAGTSEND